MELQQELIRIKAERAAAQQLKQQQESDEQERSKTENALKGNPLLDFDGSNTKV